MKLTDHFEIICNHHKESVKIPLQLGKYFLLKNANEMKRNRDDLNCINSEIISLGYIVDKFYLSLIAIYVFFYYLSF